MAWADPLSAAPGRARAVRSSGHEPQVVPAGEHEVVDVAARCADELQRRRPDGTVAVVAAAPRLAALRGQIDRAVEVHTPETAKGLEFDGVVVVEPAELAGGPAGPAPLYIAMTRATTHLSLVHASPLPGPLAERG
jgi:superfamily I DNA/RNA helicase